VLRTAFSMTGYELEASDGLLGTVKEFYFDDDHWTVRYLVADTGTWLSGRHVLLSPHALVAVLDSEQRITLNLSKQQVESSPSLNSDEPVSRQFERDYHGFYGWPPYWGGPLLWGPYPYIMGNPALFLLTTNTPGPEGASTDVEEGDPHLRSTAAVRGYQIQAIDGPIGHVDDFVIDDETWTIRYLVVKAHEWWPGKRILVAPEWIGSVSWSESKVFISVSKEAIKTAPPMSEESLLRRDYEENLHKHYGRKGYWA